MNSKTVTALIGMGTIAFVAGLIALSALKETWRVQEELKNSKAVVEILRANAKANDEIFNRMVNTNLRMSEDLYKVKTELDRMKGRSDTVLKKPELVEKMIQESFSGFGKEIECATGLQSSCL